MLVKGAALLGLLWKRVSSFLPRFVFPVSYGKGWSISVNLLLQKYTSCYEGRDQLEGESEGEDCRPEFPLELLEHVMLPFFSCTAPRVSHGKPSIFLCILDVTLPVPADFPHHSSPLLHPSSHTPGCALHQVPHFQGCDWNQCGKLENPVLRKHSTCWPDLCTWHSAFEGQHSRILLGVWFDVHQPLLWWMAAGGRASCPGVPGEVWCLVGNDIIKNVSDCSTLVQSCELDGKRPSGMHRYNCKWKYFEGNWKSGRKLWNIFRKMQPSASSFISPHTHSSFFFRFRIGRNKPKAVLTQL